MFKHISGFARHIVRTSRVSPTCHAMAGVHGMNSTHVSSNSTSTQATVLVRHDVDVTNCFEIRTIDLPAIEPNEILVEVLASTVNPIDVDMATGYGRGLLDTIRPLPVVLGRECTGRVVQVGSMVSDACVGDIVWCTPSPIKVSGTHAKYTVVNETELCLAPTTLSPVESAAIPFSALTAWKALVDIAQCIPSPVYTSPTLHQAGLQLHDIFTKIVSGSHIQNWTPSFFTSKAFPAAPLVSSILSFLNKTNAKQANVHRGSFNTPKSKQRVYIHGGSGPVGRLAVQLLKHFDLQVAVSCSAKNVESMYELGADVVLSYEDRDWSTTRIWEKEDKCDVVLDCAGGVSLIPFFTQNLTSGGKLVVLYQLMKSFNNENSLISGSVETMRSYTQTKMDLLNKYNVEYHYAFFEPNSNALGYIRNLVEQGIITPAISRVVSTPLEAMQIAQRKETTVEGNTILPHVQAKYQVSGGKVIIDMQTQI